MRFGTRYQISFGTEIPWLSGCNDFRIINFYNSKFLKVRILKKKHEGTIKFHSKDKPNDIRINLSYFINEFGLVVYAI